MSISLNVGKRVAMPELSLSRPGAPALWSRCFRLLIGLLIAGIVGCASVRNPLSVAEDVDVDVAATQAAAESNYAEGNWTGAAQHYATLVEAVPKDPELWFRLANAYARSEQPDRAISAYREALARDPALSKAWFNLGMVQLHEAAFSFNKLDGDSNTDEQMRLQADHMYRAILEILDAKNNQSPP